MLLVTEQIIVEIASLLRFLFSANISSFFKYSINKTAPSGLTLNNIACTLPEQSSGGVLQKRCSTLLKKRPWHRCFAVNFAKFLRTPFFIELLRWLFLKHLKTFAITFHTHKSPYAGHFKALLEPPFTMGY